MARETAYLSLGSNLGNRFGTLRAAISRLGSHSHTAMLQVSAFYETEPQGFIEQPWFLNLAVLVQTELTPMELMSFAQEIEQELGRDRQNETRWGPRNVDIDILLFGTLIVQNETLTIPHPRMWQRRFVLEPLLEIAGDLADPVTGRSLRYYLSDVQDQDLRFASE